MPRTFSSHALAAIVLGVAAAGPAVPAAATASQPPASSFRSDRFEAVSCTMAKGCLAVGSRYSGSVNATRALGETQDPGGSTWAVRDPAPIPGSAESGFSAVSCVPSPPAGCMGVGSSGTTAELFNYAATWNWSKWTSLKPPNPSPTHFSGLDAVSCLSARFCVATGHWFDHTAGEYKLQGQVWNGKTWAMTKMPPLPANASSSPQLSGISCVSTTWCMAVGDYNVGPGGTQPLLSEIWNGKSWTMHLPPDPPGSSVHALSGVSCVSTRRCDAVGESFTAQETTLSLGETWNGTSWTIQPTPEGKQKTGSELFGVSCPSASFCLSLGELAAEWNGKSWSGIVFPAPAGSFAKAFSVSCLSASDCTGAGAYSVKAGGTHTMAWHWNGKSLSVQKAQNP